MCYILVISLQILFTLCNCFTLFHEEAHFGFISGFGRVSLNCVSLNYLFVVCCLIKDFSFSSAWITGNYIILSKSGIIWNSIIIIRVLTLLISIVWIFWVIQWTWNYVLKLRKKPFNKIKVLAKTIQLFTILFIWCHIWIKFIGFTLLSWKMCAVQYLEYLMLTVGRINLMISRNDFTATFRKCMCYQYSVLSIFQNKFQFNHTNLSTHLIFSKLLVLCVQEFLF